MTQYHTHTTAAGSRFHVVIKNISRGTFLPWVPGFKMFNKSIHDIAQMELEQMGKTNLKKERREPAREGEIMRACIGLRKHLVF